MKSLNTVKTTTIITLVVILCTSAASTDLNNIENIRPSATGSINVTGNLDLQGNRIDGFFGAQCGAGEFMVDVGSDGSLGCVSASGSVQSDFVNRGGDSMTGGLQMQGNSITGTGDLRGSVGSDPLLEDYALGIDHPSSSTTVSPSNNVLAFADQQYSVSVTSGPSPNSGPLGNIFDLKGQSDARWDSSQSLPVTVTIDNLPDEHWRLFHLGFNWGRYPGYVKLEGYDSGSGSWVTVGEKTNNQKVDVLFDANTDKYNALRVTLDDASANTHDQIAWSVMMGTNEAWLRDDGTFLPRDGSSGMLGNIRMNGNNIEMDGGEIADSSGTLSIGPQRMRFDSQGSTIQFTDSGGPHGLSVAGGEAYFNYRTAENHWQVEDSGNNNLFSVDASSGEVDVTSGNLDVNGNRIQGINGYENNLGTRTDVLELNGNNAGDDTVDYHVEVARISTTNYDGSDSGADWNRMGPVEFDIREKYWGSGGKVEAVVSAGRYSDEILDVTEASGKYTPNVYLGSAVDTGNDENGRSVWYIPVYVELRSYKELAVEVTHSGEVVSPGNINDAGEVSYPLSYSQQGASQYSGGIDMPGVDVGSGQVDAAQGTMRLPTGTDAY